MINSIPNTLFYVKQQNAYPPFKNGLYMEEYFYEYIKRNETPLRRKYIPAYWTNFQIQSWFPSKKASMQQALNAWVRMNPSPTGYFTIVQYDDAVLLQLPANTIVFGGCSGDIPLPLIYEDTSKRLQTMPRKSFQDKKYLCSFVGNITSNHVKPNVRQAMFDTLKDVPDFHLIDSGGWKPIVNESLQSKFIEITSDSKFALAPRGYGRSSFRFFEIFELGSIPVYIYNDRNWLPFQDKIEYSKLCIVVSVHDIKTIPNRLRRVTEDDYLAMQNYYETIKHFFQLEGMCDEICANVGFLEKV